MSNLKELNMKFKKAKKEQNIAVITSLQPPEGSSSCESTIILVFLNHKQLLTTLQNLLIYLFWFILATQTNNM